MRFPAGRAPGLWLTLLAEPARRMPGSFLFAAADAGQFN